MNLDVNLNRTMDIFGTMNRINRLKILLILRSGRHTVGELTRILYPDQDKNRLDTRTSAALAPMRQLGLVKRIRDKKYMFYELDDLGREVIRTINVIDKLDSKTRNPILVECESNSHE